MFGNFYPQGDAADGNKISPLLFKDYQIYLRKIMNRQNKPVLIVHKKFNIGKNIRNFITFFKFLFI
jgi:hypothetical protein